MATWNPMFMVWLLSADPPFVICVCPSFLRKPSCVPTSIQQDPPSSCSFVLERPSLSKKPLHSPRVQDQRSVWRVSHIMTLLVSIVCFTFLMIECNILNKSSLLRDHNPLVPDRICSVESSSPLFPLSTPSSFPPAIRDTCFIHIFSEIFWARNIECNPFAFSKIISLSLKIKMCTGM